MTTTKPVSIIWMGYTLPLALEALKAEGHKVRTIPPYEDVDLIMGPKCWRIMPEQMKFLPLAIKEARAAQPKRPRANTQRKAKDPAV